MAVLGPPVSEEGVLGYSLVVLQPHVPGSCAREAEEWRMHDTCADEVLIQSHCTR